MKEFFSSPYFVYPLIIAGMVADFKYGIQWAGNISLFVLWAFIIIMFLSLLASGKDIFNNKSSNIKVALCFICLFVQVAIGWVFTAVFFAIGWFFLYVKKAVYYQELKEVAREK